MLLHLDTDFAGDTDDACALAMVLGWPDTEVVGITTTADPEGLRAGYLAHFLGLAGRADIPVAAGAAVSLTTGRTMGGLPDHERYWREPVAAQPSPPGSALDLLAQSIERNATVVAIGPYTNLALLEQARPGSLDQVPVVVMGGWVRPPDEGLPHWGPEADWNVQCDTGAALVVAHLDRLTMVPLHATLGAHLRTRDLPRLAASGPMGELLAHQARAYGEDNEMDRTCSGPHLPARRPAQLPPRPSRMRRCPGMVGCRDRGGPDRTGFPRRSAPVSSGGRGSDPARCCTRWRCLHRDLAFYSGDDGS